MDKLLKIYTDGGARGNPGPAGAAFLVIYDTNIFYKDSKYLGIKTNNEAEYQALLMSLEWLVANTYAKKFKSVVIFMDSELIVKQMLGDYRVKSKNLLFFYKKAKKLEKEFKKKIYYKNVKREKNILADKLVNVAIDENL